MKKPTLEQVLENHIGAGIKKMKLSTLKQLCEISEKQEEVLKSTEFEHKYNRMSWMMIDLEKSKTILFSEKKPIVSAKEKIILIKAATAEELESYQEGEERKTVLEAIEKRKTELSEEEKE